MRQRIDRGVGLVGHAMEVGPIAHAVLGEQLEGVVAEAGIEIGKQPGGRDVGSQFKHATVRNVPLLHHRGIVRHHQEWILDPGNEGAVGLTGLVGCLPIGIRRERLPGRFAGLAAGSETSLTGSEAAAGSPYAIAITVIIGLTPIELQNRLASAT